MTSRPQRLAWAAALTVAAVVCVLALTPAAMAIGPPTGLGSTPGTPSRESSWTFSWSPPAAPPAAGHTVAYRWGIDGTLGDVGAQTSAPVTGLGEGAHVFQVRALELDGLGAPVADSESAPVTRRVLVDQTAPTITGRIEPASPNGLNGWYTRATIRWTCADPGGSGVGTCPAAEVLDSARADRDQNTPRNIQSASLEVSGTAMDRVGLPGTASVGPFRFDALGPTAGQPKQPGTDARIGAEPTFTWSRAGNDTSGVDRYEVWVEEPLRVPRLIASVSHITGRSEFSSARTTGIPLVTLARVSWYVRSIDRAGNARSSRTRSFTIDPTAPPAPAITAGPVGPTRSTAPVFEWRGAAGTTFQWDLTAVGADDTTVVQKGSGAATRAALTPLTDGDYVFRVTQTSSTGVVSAEATSNFEVDTVAPPPPVITARASAASPAYSWATEPGAFSRWSVAGAGDAVVRPSTDTPATSAGVGDLPAGSYTFRVQQIDVAGNVSQPASEPFAVAAAAAASVQVRAARTVLPRRNASRLRPAAGRTVLTRRPVLSWSGGPRRAMLYNLQLFRVVTARAGRAPVVRKVHSAFPRGHRYRVPKAATKPGSCYVWRVWPFVGTAFARTPLGVSNFCVASRARLRAAARAAAAGGR